MRNATLTIPSDSVLKETKIAVRNLPLCPEINLFLLEEDYPKEPVSRFEFNANIASPPYWAFCWASGQALARFILDNRALVQDKKVLDFGAGSGVAGIAAAKAGARTVVACDIDPEARKAIQANADLNQVAITTVGAKLYSPIKTLILMWSSPGMFVMIEKIYPGLVPWLLVFNSPRKILRTFYAVVFK